MTTTTTIPLSKLAPWSGNVRKTGAKDGIDELAASIAAHGLLQSLVVRKGKRGKYEIIGGQRRYLALRSLVQAGTIDADYDVPCMLATDTSDATELSLAENVIRAPMHPADQFEAYRKLIDDGATVADVAARFGMSELAVNQRLKLGRLSPTILAAYREGEINLECAQAFTITDDHKAQDRVFAQLTSWSRQAHTIRRALTEDEVATSDKRVRFIGLDAYASAGGVIRQDLFSEDGEGYVTDVALLDRLVTQKLQTVSDGIATEGWKWTQSAIEADHQTLSRFARRHPERVELSEAEQAEFDALSEEYDRLVDTDDDEAADRLADIESRIDVINAASEKWSAETLAIAGAIVSLGYNGDVRIDRGLVRKEDLPKDIAHSGTTADLPADCATERTGLSERLIEELTAEKSAAIGAELMTRPDLALTTVVHAMLLDAMFPGQGTQSCLKLRVTAPGLAFSMAKPELSKGLSALTAEKDRLGDDVPGDPRELWQWCLNRSRDELLMILAYLTGYAVDAIRHKNERVDSSRLIHADQLAAAMELGMAQWYTPTAECYFSRIQRSDIITAIDEAKGSHAPSLEKLKKAELAIRAEALVANTGWLPKPLRGNAEAALCADEIGIAAE